MKKILLACFVSVLSASSIAQISNVNTVQSNNQSNTQSINNTNNTAAIASNIENGNQSSKSNTHQFGEQSYEVGLKKIETTNNNKILLIKLVGYLLVGAIIISSVLYLYTSRKHKNADGIMHE